MSIVIAGIHTGTGKTICSAVICQALGYDYWKPVQAGDIGNTDSMITRQYVSNPLCTVHAEAYRLGIAASPHYAAAQEGFSIDPERLTLPQSGNQIVVETAGGIMSPLAKNYLNIDLIAALGLPVILVASHYLGSINHSLLSHAVLAARGIKIRGIVFSGSDNSSSREFILEHTRLPLLFSIPLMKSLDAGTISQFASSLTLQL